jgi:hypothetical protein
MQSPRVSSTASQAGEMDQNTRIDSTEHPESCQLASPARNLKQRKTHPYSALKQPMSQLPGEASQKTRARAKLRRPRPPRPVPLPSAGRPCPCGAPRSGWGGGGVGGPQDRLDWARGRRGPWPRGGKMGMPLGGAATSRRCHANRVRIVYLVYGFFEK